MAIKRHALNRGTAVHLGGFHVRFVWPCGCTRDEAMRYANGVGWGTGSTIRWVLYARRNGAVLEQCPTHPDWFSKDNQVPRLNREHPNA